MSQMRRLPPTISLCLKALDQTTQEGEYYVPFLPIMRATGLGRKIVRKNIRFLARQGFAQYARGLVDEDGVFMGSGYSITNAGKNQVDFESDLP
jgi:hypothetical protein